MHNPIVSVIIPTHNRLALLKKAVDSALNQTENRIEVIVVNDVSTDGTQEYLQALADANPRVKLVSNEVSKGGAGTRNRGIAVATGKWIAFLDDDDEWLPNKLELQLKVLGKNSRAVACSSSYTRCHLSGKRTYARVAACPDFETLLGDNVLGGASLCVCDAAVLRRIGGFDASFRSGQDWDLWARLSLQGEILSCDEPTVLYRVHEGPRISTNGLAQYQGARRFYLKFKAHMDGALRKKRLAYVCFVKSRQTTIPTRKRLQWLLLAVFHSPGKVGFRYVRSSAPRIAFNALLGLSQRFSAGLQGG